MTNSPTAQESVTDHHQEAESGAEPHILELILRLDRKIPVKELLVRLVKDRKFLRFTISDLVLAVDSCGGLAFEDQHLLAYLDSKCRVCSRSQPRHAQVAFLRCPCQQCFDCFRQFVVKCCSLEHSNDPRRFSCPGCGMPRAQHDEQFATHLNFLNLLLEEISATNPCWVDQEVLSRFGKATDECYEQLNIDKARYANTLTPVQPAHEMLKERGFQCPKCQQKYSLAKSVDEKFHCARCGHGFCPCCGAPFVIDCKVKHERRCYFSMMSEGVQLLQFLLTEFKVPFEQKVGIDKKFAARKCKAADFMQARSNDAFSNCTDDVFKGTSVCQRHYKEYLVDLVNLNKLTVSAWCRFKFAALGMQRSVSATIWNYLTLIE